MKIKREGRKKKDEEKKKKGEGRVEKKGEWRGKKEVEGKYRQLIETKIGNISLILPVDMNYGVREIQRETVMT